MNRPVARTRTRAIPGVVAALLAALTLAACTDDGATATSPSDAAHAGAGAARRAEPSVERTTETARWTRLTHTILGRRPLGPLFGGRTLTLVAVAQYNAVIAAEDAKVRRVHPSEAGAVAGASATVLTALFPAEGAVIEAQLAATAAAFPLRPSERHMDFAAGVAVGQRAAQAVLAYAATDRSDAPATETFPTGPTTPGLWYSAPPPAAPILPLWGEVRPWLLESGDQFRPPPPPEFGSPEYLADLAEVRQLSDTRTPEQLAIAQFWGTAAANPAGWSGYVAELALALAARRHFDERKTARLLAVLQMAEMDASIACWEAKYHYRTIRPWQVDPAITTPVGRPNFPAYPAGHSCGVSAAAGVLAGSFPSEAERMRALVEEAGLARIYGGVHFRFDVEAGQQLGAAVARVALRKAPRGHRPIPLD